MNSSLIVTVRLNKIARSGWGDSSALIDEVSANLVTQLLLRSVLISLNASLLPLGSPSDGLVVRVNLILLSLRNSVSSILKESGVGLLLRDDTVLDDRYSCRNSVALIFDEFISLSEEPWQNFFEEIALRLWLHKLHVSQLLQSSLTESEH